MTYKELGEMICAFFKENGYEDCYVKFAAEYTQLHTAFVSFPNKRRFITIYGTTTVEYGAGQWDDHKLTFDLTHPDSLQKLLEAVNKSHDYRRRSNFVI